MPRLSSNSLQLQASSSGVALLLCLVCCCVANAAGLSSPPQSEVINQQIASAWKDLGIRPSAEATDAEWCRRLFLDLVGRIPNVDELRSFLANKAPNKREQLVDQLLGDEYLEEYARNWTTIWTNLLVGRTGGTNNQSLVNRDGMRQYLRRCFQKNKPFDQMMEELVTATGSCRPGDDDFNGAANFLADKMSEGGIQATAQTSRLFLGVAVQCTQCHNHPFNEYRQNQFWELNAFFRQRRVERLPSMTNRNVGRVAARNFAGQGGDPTKAEVYYELRNGKLKVAYPTFIDGTSLAELHADKGEDFGDSGYLSDIERLEELAKLIRRSEEFPLAIVNRYWGHFFGVGFTKPVDDMGPHNPPSHPELLTELASQFRSQSFDTKAMIRWIVLSRPYGLSSRATKSNEDDHPESGQPPAFSRFYLRQMQAEQLYESLLTATQADKGMSYSERERSKQQWLRQFNRSLGNDENGESTSFSGSIPQVLMMMNGPVVKRATSLKRGSFLSELAADSTMAPVDKINLLYEAALSRRPSREERAVCGQLFAARSGDLGESLRDVWWALLNSNEFLINH